MEITVDQLLAKIGQLTVLNDAKDARIAELETQLAAAITGNHVTELNPPAERVSGR